LTAPFRPVIDLTQAPTVNDFVFDDAFVTGILGPLGSGKSVGCVAKILRLSMLQEPDGEGWRRTRWAIIRNTYPELRSTTIKTWEEIMRPEHCGPVVQSHPINHHIRVKPNGFAWLDRDNGLYRGSPGFDMEAIFVALDRPADVRHLKSLDLTGAWINEAVELPREILDMLTGRVGRFPREEVGGATWCGIIMDTNACDDDHWWYAAAERGEGLIDLSHLEIPGLAGRKLDLRWRFYRQPPAVLEVRQAGGGFEVCEAGFEPIGVPASQVIQAAGRWWCVNQAAENLKFLRPGYYHQQIANKLLEWVNRFMQAKYIYLADGKPWVPEYDDRTMARSLVYQPALPLLGGIDCGGGTLMPAAAIGQRGSYGDWRTLAELSVFDMGIDRFSRELSALLDIKFGAQAMPKFALDPAAAQRDQVYETAVEEHLRSRGFDVTLAPTNDPVVRREALALPMTRSARMPDGQMVPGFMVDTSCHKIRAGLAGKWFRRRVQVSGAERHHEKPEKNEYSHPCEAAGYMCLTFGEHRQLTRGQTQHQPKAWQGQPRAAVDFDVFG